MFPKNRFLSVKAILLVAVAATSSGPRAFASAAFGLPDGSPPTIGAWFCGDDFMEPDGYKKYIDLFADHSPYDLLPTSVRLNRREITEPAVHDQTAAAAAYARERGLKIALDLDVRLAREAFRSQYPDHPETPVVDPQPLPKRRLISK